MDIDKVRYYLSGIICLVIALICIASVWQQVREHTYYTKVLILDAAVIVILLPLAIVLLTRARKMQ